MKIVMNDERPLDEVVFSTSIEDGDFNVYANGILLAFFCTNGKLYKAYVEPDDRAKLEAAGVAFDSEGEIVTL